MADAKMFALIPVHVDAPHIDGAVVELHLSPDGIVSAEIRIPAPDRQPA